MNDGRAVWRIGFIIGIGQLGFAVVLPLLPLHLTERLGASVKLVGLIVATFALVETFFKTAWGGVADRWGRRPLVVGGLLLASLAPLAMTVLRVPVLFVPLRLVDGLGSAALWPAAAAAVADVTAPNRRATGMAALNMFFLLGLSAGPALGLFVAGWAGDFRAGFLLASALLVLAALLAALVFPRDNHHGNPNEVMVGYHTAVPPAHLETIVGTLRSNPLLFALYLVAFVQMLGAGLLVPIAAIYAKRVIGLSEHAIGVVFLSVVIAVGVATVPAGRLADRVGKPHLMAAGMLLGTAGMWILALSEQFVELVVAAVLLGASYAISTPALLALVSELAPPGRLGLALGASETVQGLGLVLGPLLGGLVWDAFGPRAPFLGSALALTAGTVIAAVALRRSAG